MPLQKVDPLSWRAGSRQEGRSIDELLAKPLFEGEGRSGAPEAERTRRRLDEPFVSVPRPRRDAAGLLALTLEDELDGLAAGRTRPYPYEGIPVSGVVEAVRTIRDGGSVSPLLYQAAAKVAALVGNATPTRASSDASPSSEETGEEDVFTLLAPQLHDDPVAERLAGLSDEALWRVVATVMARSRASWLQDRSDPDAPRLGALRVAARSGMTLAEALSWPALRRWHLGEDPLARPSGREARDRADSASWRDGAALAWRAVRRFEEAATGLLGFLDSGAPDLAGVEAVGALGLLEQSLAAKALARHRRGLPVRFREAAGGTWLAAPDAAERVRLLSGSARRDQELCRLAGWLPYDVEEQTFLDRGLRPLRRDGVPLDALVRFADEGDPGCFVKPLDAGFSPAVRTRYVLKMDESERDTTVGDVVSLARVAAQALFGLSLPLRGTRGEAAFYRFPRQVVADSTVLPGELLAGER
jgi:hypothetical protein